MKKEKDKIFFGVVAGYLAVFYVLPLIFSIGDFFTKDFGSHLRYMLYVFLPLSMVFSLLAIKIYGFSKKKMIVLVVSLALSCLISIAYVYGRGILDFELNF